MSGYDKVLRERERVMAKAEYGHPLASVGGWFQDPRKHPNGLMFCGKTLYAKWPPKPKEPRGPQTKQTSPASQFKVFLIGNFLTETHSSMAAGQNGSPHRSLPGPPVLYPFRNGLRTPKGIQGCWRERRGPDAGGALEGSPEEGTHGGGRINGSSRLVWRHCALSRVRPGLEGRGPGVQEG